MTPSSSGLRASSDRPAAISRTMIPAKIRIRFCMIFSSKESNRLGPRIDLLRSVLALSRRFKKITAVFDLTLGGLSRSRAATPAIALGTGKGRGRETERHKKKKVAAPLFQIRWGATFSV